MEKDKNKFMSLEYIVGDNTYWIMSYRKDDKEDIKIFLEIPKKDLPNIDLKPCEIYRNSPYTEIYETMDGVWSIGTSDLSDTLIFEGLDVALYTEISPKELIDMCIKTLDWSNLMALYHNNIVRPKKDCKWEFQDVDYKVTAFLPEMKKVAIYGSNYSADNRNWITIDFDKEPDISEFLYNFDVVAMQLFGEGYKQVW